MCGKTHLAAGICAGAAVSLAIGASPLDAAFITATSAFGSLWPDIDHKTSKISSRFKFLSWICSTIFGHRGLLHNPIFYLILMVGLLFFVEFRYIYPLFMGIGTHLMLDAITPQGIPTMRKKKRLIKIRMGGIFEKATCLACSVTTIVMGVMWADHLLSKIM